MKNFLQRTVRQFFLRFLTIFYVRSLLLQQALKRGRGYVFFVRRLATAQLPFRVGLDRVINLMSCIESGMVHGLVRSLFQGGGAVVGNAEKSS